MSVPTGTVIASFLAWGQFRRAAGVLGAGDWCPCDGRRVPKRSRYARITRKTKVPDLRGMFIRGTNRFDSGRERTDRWADPEGLRPAGQFQPDELVGHRHKGGGESSAHTGPDAWSNNHFHGGVGGPPTDEFGGAETRPRNMSVHYYIKVT